VATANRTSSTGPAGSCAQARNRHPSITVEEGAAYLLGAYVSVDRVRAMLDAAASS
jgi:hypothetical protein